MKSIKPIHPFGPAVGKWKSHGTVADTFARIRKQLAEQHSQQQRDAEEAKAKISVIQRRGNGKG